MRSRIFLLGLIIVGAVPASAADCIPANAIPRSCTLLKDTKAIFVGTPTEETPRYRFHVDENIKGVKGDFFDLEPYPISMHFEIGKQYLVFVDTMQLDDGKHLFAQECGPTDELKYAQGALRQMQAEKNGKKNAAVYGTLVRTSDSGVGIVDDDYIRPLPGVIVKFQSKDASFAAKTDEHGAYAFESLPRGTYRISADLPPALELSAPLSKDPPVFEMPDSSCYDNLITAMPTGLISGRVIAPNGAPLRDTSIELFPVEMYEVEKAGASGYQGDPKPFEFAHLPPGDYVLVFNRTDEADPDAPFSRTFYPDAPDLASAHIIHLKGGQQMTNADIHLRPSSTPTRNLTIRLSWDKGKPEDYYPPAVIVEAGEGPSPYPYNISDGIYSLNLLRNARYTVRAEAFCKMGTAGKAEFDSVTVDGADSLASEVVLKFHGGECVAQ